jgi:hypothetical protein
MPTVAAARAGASLMPSPVTLHQIPHCGHFIRGQQTGPHIRDTHLGGDGLGRGRVVPGEHDQMVHPHGLQCGQNRTAVLSHGVGHGDVASVFVPRADQEGGLTQAGCGIDLGALVRRVGHMGVKMGVAADQHGLPGHGPGHPGPHQRGDGLGGRIAVAPALS